MTLHLTVAKTKTQTKTKTKTKTKLIKDPKRSAGDVLHLFFISSFPVLLQFCMSSPSFSLFFIILNRFSSFS